MRIKFKDVRFNRENDKKLTIINNVVEEYKNEGYQLTLRQLYYQLVARDIIPNNIKEYAKISELLKKGRMGGIVDWNAIVDRNRTPRLPYCADSIEDAIDDTVRQYRRDRQDNQLVYVELWVEKDALSEILYRRSSHYHVRLMVNRGYSSCTAMYEAANRFRCEQRSGKECHLLYLGDHDPSGLDMIRDIRNRFSEFGLNDIDVRHVALTMDQIDEHDPPPNPTKIKDPRAGWYIGKYGQTCWEVDALTPQVLHENIDEAIRDIIDIDEFNSLIEEEKTERIEISKLPLVNDSYDRIKEHLESMKEHGEIDSVEEFGEFVDELLNML